MRIAFLDELQRPVLGRPHLFTDPLLQIVIVLRDTLLLSQFVLDRFLDNVLGDLNTDFPHVLDVWQEPGSGVIDDRGCGGQGLHSGDEKRGCDETCAREDGAQTDAGEGNGVVAFSWISLVRILQDRGMY
jgi:hypothetical protein